MKNLLKVLLLLACVYTLNGCREIKYLVYYPHPLLGAIETSANWQEFAIPPLNFEKYDLLGVTFSQGDRTVCNTGLSLFHLCSPEASKKLENLLDQYRAQLDGDHDPYDPRLDAIQKEMSDLVASEPLPDLAMELVTEPGDIEIYEPSFAGGREDHKLRFEFRSCNQSTWNREKLDAGVSEDEAKYSYAEIDAHQKACDESHTKTFVKMRLRSPAGMQLKSIKIENANSPFVMR